MGTVTILDGTTKNPITKIGEMAGVCWGADTTDDAKNYKRGWDCIESGHGRTLEFVNVELLIEGYSARVIREWYTHIGGAPTRLQASTRYIDYGRFDYIIPPSIAADEQAKRLYTETMWQIREAIMALEGHELPREDIANLLPLGMTTRIVDKRNLRNLIDMSRNRECIRALWEYRELFGDLIVGLNNYSEEWERITTTQFMPKCNILGYCPERNGCGMYPRKGKDGA